MTKNKRKLDRKGNTEAKKTSENEKKGSKDEKRQFRKWEAARRQRFNAVLEELRLELPDCGPRAKVEVVLTAIKFIQECKTLKESFLAGNAPQELKREIRRLMKQVASLKHRNALLVKLLQETGLRFEAEDGNGDIIYTMPGTCVQTNCANASVRKVAYNQRVPVIVDTKCPDSAASECHSTHQEVSGQPGGEETTDKGTSAPLSDKDEPIVNSGLFHSQSTATGCENFSENRNSAILERRESERVCNSSQSVISLPSLCQRNSHKNNSKETPSVIVPDTCDINQPSVDTSTVTTAVISQISGSKKEDISSLHINCVGDELTVLPQTVQQVHTEGSDQSKEKIIVEGVEKGTVTVSIIEEEAAGTSSIPSTNTPTGVRNERQSNIERVKISSSGKDNMLASGTCLVVQDMQNVQLDTELQPQPVSRVPHISVPSSNSCTSQPQMVTLQVQREEKGSGKGQKVVLLQCGNPGPGTIQLVSPLTDNSQLTYVTPSLSGLPIMSTGVPPPILHGGKVMKMMNTSPLLLLPSQPFMTPVPQPPRLKPIAPKPCACKPITPPHSRGGSHCIQAPSINPTSSKIHSPPSKKDSLNVSSKLSAKVKRLLPVDKCESKPTKRNRTDYEPDIPVVSKLNPPLHTLQPLHPEQKPIPITHVEMPEEQGQDLQEISTSTLTGLVHSAGIMDCVEEDPLGTIMDIRVDMPCVMGDNMRGAGIDSNNPTDDRLVEMLRSIDESDPRSCDFSPPTSPVSTSENFVKEVKQPEPQTNKNVVEQMTSTVSQSKNKLGVSSSESSQVTSSSVVTGDLSSSSYSITALCLSSRPPEDLESSLHEISTHPLASSSAAFIAELPDGLAEPNSAVISSSLTANIHPRVSTPLVLPTSVYPSPSSPLLSREQLPKASSAPTFCQFPVPLASLPPTSVFHRPPSTPLTSNSHTLPLTASSHTLPLSLPPLPVSHLTSLPLDHFSHTLHSSQVTPQSDVCSIAVTNPSTMSSITPNNNLPPSTPQNLFHATSSSIPLIQSCTPVLHSFSSPSLPPASSSHVEVSSLSTAATSFSPSPSSPTLSTSAVLVSQPPVSAKISTSLSCSTHSSATVSISSPSCSSSLDPFCSRTASSNTSDLTGTSNSFPVPTTLTFSGSSSMLASASCLSVPSTTCQTRMSFSDSFPSSISSSIPSHTSSSLSTLAPTSLSTFVSTSLPTHTSLSLPSTFPLTCVSSSSTSVASSKPVSSSCPTLIPMTMSHSAPISLVHTGSSLSLSSVSEGPPVSASGTIGVHSSANISNLVSSAGTSTPLTSPITSALQHSVSLSSSPSISLPFTSSAPIPFSSSVTHSLASSSPLTLPSSVSKSLTSAHQMASPASTFSFSLTIPTSSTTWSTSSSGQSTSVLPLPTCNSFLFSSSPTLPHSTSSVFSSSFLQSLQSLSSTNTCTPSPLPQDPQTVPPAPLLSCSPSTFTTLVMPTTQTSLVPSLPSDLYGNVGLEGLPHASSMYATLGTKIPVHDFGKTDSMTSLYTSLPHFPEISSSSVNTASHCMSMMAPPVGSSLLPLLPQIKPVTSGEEQSSAKVPNKKRGNEVPITTDQDIHNTQTNVTSHISPNILGSASQPKGTVVAQVPVHQVTVKSSVSKVSQSVTCVASSETSKPSLPTLLMSSTNSETKEAQAQTSTSLITNSKQLQKPPPVSSSVTSASQTSTEIPANSPQVEMTVRSAQPQTEEKKASVPCVTKEKQLEESLILSATGSSVCKGNEDISITKQSLIGDANEKSVDISKKITESQDFKPVSNDHDSRKEQKNSESKEAYNALHSVYKISRPSNSNQKISVPSSEISSEADSVSKVSKAASVTVQKGEVPNQKSSKPEAGRGQDGTELCTKSTVEQKQKQQELAQGVPCQISNLDASKVSEPLTTSSDVVSVNCHLPIANSSPASTSIQHATYHLLGPSTAKHQTSTSNTQDTTSPQEHIMRSPQSVCDSNTQQQQQINASQPYSSQPQLQKNQQQQLSQAEKQKQQQQQQQESPPQQPQQQSPQHPPQQPAQKHQQPQKIQVPPQQQQGSETVGKQRSSTASGHTVTSQPLPQQNLPTKYQIPPKQVQPPSSNTQLKHQQKPIQKQQQQQLQSQQQQPQPQTQPQQQQPPQQQHQHMHHQQQPLQHQHQQQHQHVGHHRAQQHANTNHSQSHLNQTAMQKHHQSMAQLAQQQNPVVQQQQVAEHSLISHNTNIIPGISGAIVGDAGDVLSDKSITGQVPGGVMQASQQPGMAAMPYHTPIVTAPSYMQPPTYDYNTYCRKPTHSPRSDSRHQCFGYGKQQQYQHGELLHPDPNMITDPRLPQNPVMPMPGPFLETADEHTSMRPEPASEHVQYFSVRNLVSHSSEPRKGSISGQQKENTVSQPEDKSKDTPRNKSGSRKSESKSRGAGGNKNSSQAESNSRRRSPARGSQQGNSGSAPTVMWGNKTSVHKQGHNYSAEALLSSQNYGRTTHRTPTNQNYSIMATNQMYQSNYSPQQMKNFVPNTSFGYPSHDRSGQSGCNPDYNFQLHTQASGSLAYGGNMAYMATGYPYQNLPSSSSSMLSGDIMAPPHPAGAYPRFHDFPADQSNFPPNPTFPLPLDPQDMCSGGGLMGAAGTTMTVRPPHTDMQLVPASSVPSSLPYSRSNSNRTSGNNGTSTSVVSSISSSNNHGAVTYTGANSKRPRYGDTNMVGGGMSSSANLLEGSALAHISLHSFTPPCEDSTLVHSNLFPATTPRHQGNFLLGADNLVPINTGQYPSSSSTGTVSSGSQLGGGGVAPPSGTRSGASVVLPPGGPPGHVPFSPLRMMDRQQVNMAPPAAPHLSSSLSNFNLTSIIPEIDGKSGDSSTGMASSSRGSGGSLANNDVLSAAMPGQARLPPMPSSLLPPSDSLKGLPADTNRIPAAVLNNSMNNIFPHPPHHQMGLGLNSSLPLPPTTFSGINFPPEH
ncbi:hypothetical protein Pcinc_008068 [Petrolisthes cinctipes]|uniref:BHLH domain-containing protein n=1 Tax=Petrolisthes cinctipes TaxID=88211 RepID=A0AAE1KXM4_PETCI|nr:hypothetical protein Pcinc_008068 [Petrolisthes cinctipes]